MYSCCLSTVEFYLISTNISWIMVKLFQMFFQGFFKYWISFSPPVYFFYCREVFLPLFFYLKKNNSSNVILRNMSDNIYLNWLYYETTFFCYFFQVIYCFSWTFFNFILFKKFTVFYLIPGFFYRRKLNQLILKVIKIRNFSSFLAVFTLNDLI